MNLKVSQRSLNVNEIDLRSGGLKVRELKENVTDQRRKLAEAEKQRKAKNQKNIPLSSAQFASMFI